MVDPRRLRYFLAVADTLHFGRAAERLNLSQPPLSRQIALLEDELGVQLFKRDAHQVRLTPAGVRLKADAKEIMLALTRAAVNAKAAATGEEGALSVGFTMCAAYSVVPRYAKAFRTRYPQVKLGLREVVSADLLTQLAAGAMDAAIVIAQPAPEGVTQLTVLQEPICLAMPVGHALAKRPSVDLALLRHEAFIATLASAAPTLHHIVLDQCAAAGFVPNIVLEVELQQTILSLVAEGVGMALVPESMRKLQLEGVAFKPLAHALTVSLNLAWRTSNENPCLANLLSVVADMGSAEA